MRKPPRPAIREADMIKPDTLWSFLKRSEDGSELTVGRVCRSLAGHPVDPPLDACERLMLNMIMESNEWHTEAIAKERERKKAYRESKTKGGQGQSAASEMSQGQSAASEMSQGQNGRDEMSVHPSIRPSVHPSVRPSALPSVQNCTNRSVTVPVPLPPTDAATPERNGTENGNGTESCEMMEGGVAEAKRRGRRFAAAVRADQGAFFDAEFDAITVLAAVTGDYGSLKRWRQLATAKGDGAVREEAFRFWREISAGEDVKNRGAALNKRLSALPDEREAASTPSAQSGRATTPPEARTRHRGKEDAV